MGSVAIDAGIDDGAALLLGDRVVECKEARGSAYSVGRIQAKFSSLPSTLVSYADGVFPLDYRGMRHCVLDKFSSQGRSNPKHRRAKFNWRWTSRKEKEMP